MENVTGKKPASRKALDVLLDEGCVSRDVTNRGHYFASVVPYREADDNAEDESAGTASPPRPRDRVPVPRR